MNPKSFLVLLYMHFLLDRCSCRFSHQKCLIVFSGRNIRTHDMFSLPNLVQPISMHPLYRFFFFFLVIHCLLSFTIFWFISTSDHYSTFKKASNGKNKTNKNPIKLSSEVLLKIDKLTSALVLALLILIPVNCINKANNWIWFSNHIFHENVKIQCCN